MSGVTIASDGPVPYKKSAETPAFGTPDSTDDIRGGMGVEGLMNLYKFVQDGGTLITEGGTATLFPEYKLTPGVTVDTHVGRLALQTISAPMLLEVLRKVEKRGANETAHTLRQTAGQVFRYGIQTGRCERNPVADLHGALKPLVVKHMAAVLEPAKAGELLRAIHGYGGQPMTRAALRSRSPTR